MFNLFRFSRYLLFVLGSLQGLATGQTTLIDQKSEVEEVYRQVSDLSNPSEEDFRLIQNYLLNGKRSYLKWLDTVYPEFQTDGCKYDLRVRTMRIWQPGYKNTSLKQFTFNTSDDDKDLCIISYTSINPNYERKQLRLLQRLHQVDYKGHFLCRTGGWPDIEGGSLSLVHVPYSFKVCMFREALRLGYKKVIWMDTTIYPLKNFNAVKDYLEKDGTLIMTNGRLRLRQHSTKKLANYFGLKKEDEEKLIPISAGILGINFEHEKGLSFFKAWYEATKALTPSLSRRPEQNLLTALADKMGIKPTCDRLELIARSATEVEKKHLFYVYY